MGNTVGANDTDSTVGAQDTDSTVGAQDMDSTVEARDMGNTAWALQVSHQEVPQMADTDVRAPQGTHPGRSPVSTWYGNIDILLKMGFLLFS